VFLSVFVIIIIFLPNPSVADLHQTC